MLGSVCIGVLSMEIWSVEEFSLCGSTDAREAVEGLDLCCVC